jgi:tetratricopeptide (TPR) repeat protein
MNSTAIINSLTAGLLRCAAVALAGGMTAALVQTSCAQATSTNHGVFLAQAEQTLTTARGRYHREPTNAEAAWYFGRACFDRGEFATNDTERATLAVEGIEVMRKLVVREPKLAAGHFYLAMNLGQFARTKLLGALTIVDEMEKEFKIARELDDHFEYAGPDRNLGQLYLQAPGWPASIGSRSKARKHLERAVELAPGFPENHLNLLEACCTWRDAKGIRREVKAIGELWPIAKTNFTGAAWASSWADWEKRRASLQAAAVIKPAR